MLQDMELRAKWLDVPVGAFQFKEGHLNHYRDFHFIWPLHNVPVLSLLCSQQARSLKLVQCWEQPSVQDLLVESVNQFMGTTAMSTRQFHEF